MAKVLTVATQKDKQLLKPLLGLFRDYCLCQKELALYFHIPEDEKQKIIQKMHTTQHEIDDFFAKQKNNQCFMIKVMRGMKEFEICILDVKLKLIQALFDELHKDDEFTSQKKKENPCINA